MRDQLDERLSLLLREDGRSSITTLSQTLGVPRHLVRARLSQLESGGNIEVTAVINPRVLDVNILAHVSISVAGSAGGVADAVLKIPQAALVSLTAGTCDLVVELRARDEREMFAIVATVRDLPGVVAVSTMLYVDIHKSPFTSMRGAPTPSRLDAVDLQLMQLLQENGRAPYRSLAAAAGISESAARVRVGSLIANNVMRITAIVKRNSATKSMAMGVGVNAVGDVTRLIAQLVTLESVEFAATVIGRFDVVFTLSAASLPQLQEVVDVIRSHDDVQRVSSWVHLEIRRESYKGVKLDDEYAVRPPIA